MITIKKIGLFCIIGLATLNVAAQEDSTFSYSKLMPGEFSYFNVDNLDNVYLVTASNQLKKYFVVPFANGHSALFRPVLEWGLPIIFPGEAVMQTIYRKKFF